LNRKQSKTYKKSKFTSIHDHNEQPNQNSIKGKASKVYNKYAKLAQESRSYLMKAKERNQRTRYKSTDPSKLDSKTSYLESGG
jgi:hypothetical protein